MEGEREKGRKNGEYEGKTEKGKGKVRKGRENGGR